MTEPPVNRRRFTIGWAPRDYHHDHDLPWREDEAIAELRPLVEAGYTMRLVANSTAPGGDDRIPIERIAAQLPAEVFIPKTVADAAEAYAGCAVVICQRMHAGLIAARVGVPVIVVRHEDKMTIFADMGMPEVLVDSATGLAERVKPYLLPIVTDDLLAKWDIGPYD